MSGHFIIFSRIVVLLYLLLVKAYYLHGQKISKQSLLHDIKFLKEAVVNGHPVNYDKTKKVSIQSVIERIKNTDSDSFSNSEYTLWIEKAIFNIGCVHTAIQSNPLKNNYKATSFIPLTASIKNGHLIISACSDNAKVGQMIESINGIKASLIIENYSEFKASDGRTNAFSKEFFHYASSKLISDYLNHAEFYIVKTIQDDFLLRGQPDIFKKPVLPLLPEIILSRKNNNFYIKEDYAILELKSFERSDIGFYEKVFSEIKAQKIQSLIIDLRHNTGGNRKAAIELTKYLAIDTFGYSILQPKLSTSKYLDRKGKFYFLLSKLKYNIGNIFKKRRTDLGNEYKYRFRPRSKNHFDGKVFIITDGFTASSATMVVSWLMQNSLALISGSQSGGGYNGNNGGTFPTITLPYSKIKITFPAFRIILDNKSDLDEGAMPYIPFDTDADISKFIDIFQFF